MRGLEDDQSSTPGSVFRTDGSVHLDASIQTSEGRWVSSSGCRIPQPIRVAADLLDEEINGLAGTGPGYGLTPRPESNVQGRPPSKDTDTVGVVARDKSGLIVCATARGTSNRPPGRVGDVPCLGADSGSRTGWASGRLGRGGHNEGYDDLRVADRILDGNGLEESMMWALDEWLEEDAEVGIIALGTEGTGHGVSTVRICRGPRGSPGSETLPMGGY